jgi:hypothetical protein
MSQVGIFPWRPAALIEIICDIPQSLKIILRIISMELVTYCVYVRSSGMKIYTLNGKAVRKFIYQIELGPVWT